MTPLSLESIRIISESLYGISIHPDSKSDWLDILSQHVVCCRYSRLHDLYMVRWNFMFFLSTVCVYSHPCALQNPDQLAVQRNFRDCNSSWLNASICDIATCFLYSFGGASRYKLTHPPASLASTLPDPNQQGPICHKPFDFIKAKGKETTVSIPTRSVPTRGQASRGRG